MTWLSHWLPQGQDSRRAIDRRRNRRIRQARRRVSVLEPLEHRMVLCAITVTQVPMTNSVSIVGDGSNIAFSLTINNDDTIFIVGTSADPFVLPRTQIDGLGVGPPGTSTQPAAGPTTSLTGAGKWPTAPA